MAERPGRMSQHVNHHLDRAARRALADRTPPDDSITQLENVAVEAWHNLIGPHGFLPVLLLLVASMVAAPLIGDSGKGMVATVIISASALLLTVFRSTDRQRARRLTLAYVSAAALAAVLALVAAESESFALDEHRLAIIVLVLNLVVQLTAFPLVLIRSFRHRRVTVNTVCATLSAYLLIGLIFTTVYRLSGQISPPFFTQYEGGGTPSPGEYAYFSFITLTTVGYGDLTAASDPGRAWVMIEAVLGQVFLVTMLARVVGMLGFQRVGTSEVFGADLPASPPPDPPLPDRVPAPPEADPPTAGPGARADE